VGSLAGRTVGNTKAPAKQEGAASGIWDRQERVWARSGLVDPAGDNGSPFHLVPGVQHQVIEGGFPLLDRESQHISNLRRLQSDPALQRVGGQRHVASQAGLIFRVKTKASGWPAEKIKIKFASKLPGNP